ncbi:MAG: O-acetyl-ADP-ribose deacetylase [Polyangiaceae bacterium]|nr:O-acetyl-ADP-ribose deacetylase [Polyangiaceae bacterium]
MHRYTLGSAVIELVQGDITRSDTEAIANAANSMLMGGGGVDGAIHRAAGPELMAALRDLKRELPGGTLATGRAVITPGFELTAKWVIHCVGPIYDREGDAAPELLAGAYRSALELCREHRIGSVSFPSISTGVYGYPLSEAAPIALGAVRESLAPSGASLCRFMLFDERTVAAYRQAAEAIFGSET